MRKEAVIICETIEKLKEKQSTCTSLSFKTLKLGRRSEEERKEAQETGLPRPAKNILVEEEQRKSLAAG